MKEKSFKKRISYNGDLKDISLQICKDYKLGGFKSNKIILMGYEDFNFILQTTKSKYFVKIFSNSRTIDDCHRYVEIMEKAIEAKIATPKLYKLDNGYLYTNKINKTNIRLCVMGFINGKTIFESGAKLNKDEIRFIAKQVSLINSIDLKPKFMEDEWAVTNFLKEFEKKKSVLSKEDLGLIGPLVKKFNELEIEKLPRCFVHGDLIVTNIMKDNQNKLWLIDFSVSNYYPRIQELAVLSCNLFFNPANKKNSQDNIEILLKEYQKAIKLTNEELNVLPIYIELAHAMHLLCANFDKIVNKNTSEENEYWLNQGRTGLKQGK
ncbi:homoserine kinase [archaeon BMS3Abin17]|nr:homoserine kinase [archaeon BMS3Abin17]HDZ61416.1 hypothetical protein [Candidatus Pacearchaeota archaeon]